MVFEIAGSTFTVIVMPTSAGDLSLSSAVGLKTLLQLPAEIVTAVLSWLDEGDLLNLRLSSKCLHCLVHDLASALYGSYIRQLKRSHGPLLQPGVAVQDISLISYLDLRARSSMIWTLAGVLSAHVASNLQLGDAVVKANEDAIRARKGDLLQQQLFPYLFCLDGFLGDLCQGLAQAGEALSSWDDELYVAATDLLFLDQQQMVSSVCSDVTSIIGVSAALKILLGVCKAKQLGPKARSPTYPFASVKRIMLARGLKPFAKLLQETTAPQCFKFKRAGEAVLRTHQPVQRASNLLHLRRLDVGVHYFSVAAYQRPVEVTEKFLEGQNIWQNAACTVLQRDFAVDPAQHDKSIQAWILHIVTEPGDSTLQVGDWQSPPRR